MSRFFQSDSPAISDQPEAFDADSGGADQPTRELSASLLATIPVDSRWRYVRWLRTSGAYAEAARVISASAARAPDSPAWRDEAATLLAEVGQHDAAIAMMGQRIADRPVATAQVKLARILLAAGRLDEANEITTQLGWEQPELGTVQTLLRDVATENGDTRPARLYHESILAVTPEQVGSLLALADLDIRDGQPELAEANLQRALAAIAAGKSTAFESAARVAGHLGLSALAESLRERTRQAERDTARPLLERVHVALGLEPPEAAGPRPPSDLPDGWVEHILGEPWAAPIDDSDLTINEFTTTTSDTELDVPVTAPPVTETDLDQIDPRALQVLQRDFGFDSLRPGQSTVIGHVLSRVDTLATMPTGAGKSLTFQLPAMVLDGVTLVLSPLIALMKDQVESLPPAVRARTTLINSTLSPEELDRELEGIARGDYQLVYAAPERLRQWRFLNALRRAGTRLVVVDEAHCISFWGHDFRPDYLNIPQALPVLGQPPVLALTATATPAIADRLSRALNRDLERVALNPFRPNLRYESIPCVNREAKVRNLIDLCRSERGPTIVYVGSRKDADSLAARLRERGARAVPYHAGLAPDIRAANQERFMDGRERIVVATVAFGMGVDKSDVRLIVHFSAPDSLEAYAQESGRAGRDGQPARCVLLHTSADRGRLTRLATKDQLTLPVLRRVYVNLRLAAEGATWAVLDPRDLLPPGSVDTNNDPIEPETDPRIALNILEEAGLIRRHPDAPIDYQVELVPEPYRDREPAGADWERFQAWSGLGGSAGSRLRVRTAQACNGTGLTPTELDAMWDRESSLYVRSGPRWACVELLPASGDVRARLEGVLSSFHAEAIKRVRHVMAYAEGNHCRHQTLARHFGHAITPCGTRCDVCDGTAITSAERTRKPRDRGGSRERVTKDDRLVVLHAVRTLPFPVGKTGLTRLLLGSAESSIQADRSPAFGALGDVNRRVLNRLLDELIEDGLLYRDENHAYKIITLTKSGERVLAEG